MRILVVDDERTIRESLARLLSLEGMKASTAADGNEAMALLGEEAFDALVLDLRMPRMDGQSLLEWMRREGLRTPVVMISAHGEVEDAVRALKSGASDYLIKPFDPAELVLRLRAVVEARRSEDLVEAGRRTSAIGGGLLGDGPAMRGLVALIERAAPGSATVLITGESGTGKELVAREIHALSPRSAEAFVAVNLGALPESLAESELFGHEKGAFTGADARRAGLFELAGAGSLFLDEIGEMRAGLQVKLLRVLQERRIRRLGGSRDIPVEARIIAATNRDLEAELRAGRFREDLYYRLDVVRIRVPPLRERREDIPLLAGAILERIMARSGGAERTLSPDALATLGHYDFPGNVRELENILERASILGSGRTIEAAELGLASSRRGGAPDPSRAVGEPTNGGSSALDVLEKAAILEALEKWDGNRSRAAAELGISRRTIINKIRRYELEDRAED
ncbi:MAG TPA: sigma-54 dependent transcriptional regulator [Rectinemataceae bacterium]|nr:sigma-54 dependent transcriptional regulator [Rectinemataceae bacterium]